MYAIAGLSGTRVMPGGLARVAADAAIDVVSTQRGGGSKDIWVLPDSSEDAVAVGTSGSPSAQVRHADIPSRVVENLSWCGRYTVRCGDNAGLLGGALVPRSAVGVCYAAAK